MAGARWLAVSVRLGAVSMVLAGVAWSAASVERWWPQCRFARLESPGCSALQDHRFDYIVPSDPWVPIGSAATLAGVGGLLMAAGLVLLLPNHAVRREQRVLAPVVAVLALLTLHDGAATFLSGRAGRPVDVSLLAGLRGPWEVVVPVALAALVFHLRSTGAGWKGWGGPAPLAVSLLLFSVSPFLELAVLPASHDAPPWSGAVSGTSMVVAGWVAWWLPGQSRRQRDREGGVARTAG